MSNEQLIKLALLSLLWGASFLFIGIAVQEIEPLLLVTLRVALAALTMLPILYLLKGRLPRRLNDWVPFIGMGILNNALPFTAIFYAQTHISVSLASITNATTPMFTFLILAALGGERLLPNKLIGSAMGLAGVALLLNLGNQSFDNTSLGILFSLSAAVSYGFSALWAKHYLTGIPPLQTATCQLISSSIVMLIALPLLGVGIPTALPSAPVLISVIALSVFSTALAYVIFFDLITKSGPSNAMLVTLLVPVSGSILGWLVMDDQLTAFQALGAITIAVALIVIDGRVYRWIKTRRAPGH